MQHLNGGSIAGMSTATNVDPQELAKFSDLAHKWWDPESEFKPLHQINPLRLDWIDQLANVKGKRVVDVGCGGGILADAMARKGADVLGIDLSVKALRVAQRMRARMEAEAGPGVTSVAGLRITSSFGVCTLPESSVASLDKLIEQADAGLYAAKESGRNRVCYAPEVCVDVAG